MKIVLSDLEKRCLEISYVNGLSHLSSVLTSVGVIDDIYASKKPGDIFVLGNSHAALALFVVLEKYGFGDASALARKHGTHASRDPAAGIFVSGGSLGQPETVAVGLALADRNRNVFLLTSDGALAEGSIWESLRIANDIRLENLHVHVIANGLGAYSEIDIDDLQQRLEAFFPARIHRVSLDGYPAWIRGIDGHYLRLDEAQYREILGSADPATVESNTHTLNHE
jgi:transketolase